KRWPLMSCRQNDGAAPNGSGPINSLLLKLLTGRDSRRRPLCNGRRRTRGRGPPFNDPVRNRPARRRGNLLGLRGHGGGRRGGDDDRSRCCCTRCCGIGRGGRSRLLGGGGARIRFLGRLLGLRGSRFGLGALVSLGFLLAAL